MKCFFSIDFCRTFRAGEFDITTSEQFEGRKIADFRSNDESVDFCLYGIEMETREDFLQITGFKNLVNDRKTTDLFSELMVYVCFKKPKKGQGRSYA